MKVAAKVPFRNLLRLIQQFLFFEILEFFKLKQSNRLCNKLMNIQYLIMDTNALFELSFSFGRYTHIFVVHVQF